MSSESCEFIKTSKIVTWNIIPREYEDYSKIVARTGKSTSESIYDALFEKVEYAGEFNLTHNGGCGGMNCKKTKAELGGMNRGSTSSVKANNDVCNFHTHPLYCYEGMGTSNPDNKTLYGWVSGEDFRETICFALTGNLIHLVFAMEGVYSIQVNPFFTQKLSELSGFERGLVISLIEEYFKATHGFRNITYNQKLVNKNGGKMVVPQDWIDCVNDFTLNTLLQKETPSIKCGIPKKGFPEANFIKGKPECMDWDKFKTYYTEGPSLYEFDFDEKKGKYRHGREIKSSEVKVSTIKKLCDTFNQLESLRNWKRGKWFNIQFSPNVYENKILDKAQFNKLKIDGIIDMWTKIRKKNKTERRKIFKFGITPIKLLTWEIKNTGKCKLTLNSVKDSNKRTLQMGKGKGKGKRKTKQNEFGNRKKTKHKKRVQAFGRNKHKR